MNNYLSQWFGLFVGGGGVIKEEMKTSIRTLFYFINNITEYFRILLLNPTGIILIN